MKFFLYLNTIRYLKFTQIYHRILYKLRKPKPVVSQAPKLRNNKRAWARSICKKYCFNEGYKFTFLNTTHTIKSAKDWNDPEIDKLWLYNLHYFDFLNTENSTQSYSINLDIIRRWIKENPPGYGNGWEPYTLSLRIINLIKWNLNGNEITEDILQSISTQLRYLNATIEYHVQANHLFSNAKALLFGGSYFDSKEADIWLKAGFEIINHEVEEQILSDGGHYERSPMYHSIILEDVLDIVNILNNYDLNDYFNNENLISTLANKSIHMISWLSKIKHPDGNISFFNDCALNVAPQFHELVSYAEIFDIRHEKESDSLFYLQDTGFFSVRNNNIFAILNAGNITPDYQPGHAHAEALSFELSLGTQRVLVNSGTSTYENSQMRHYQRSTQAHNTLQIDNINSAEVWGSFRVAKRALISDISFKSELDRIKVTATHNGYCRLHGHPKHKRSWDIGASDIMVIDKVSGNGKHLLKSRFYFHPNLYLSRKKDIVFVYNTDNKLIMTLETDNDTSFILESTLHFPEFGKQINNTCIVYEKNCSLPSEITTKILLQ